MASVRPLGDRLLVQVVSRPGQSTGGVILPENVRTESDRGVVLAIGPGTVIEGPVKMRVRAEDMKDYGFGGRIGGPPDDVEYTPMHRPVLGIEVGDTVVFSVYAGSTVEVEGKSFLLIREGDIIGVLDGNEPVVTDEATE